LIVDELGFLVQSDAGDIRSLLRSANEHWSTLPILAFRCMWRLVGMPSYAPYQALVVTLHLTTAALLRTVMRRAGVGPWIATALAAAFVWFGTGHEGILPAAQIGFDGSLVFGLVHLLLADHDGPVAGRDWGGLCAGVAGLLCSGVAVTMTIAVSLAVLPRRGWRIALLHTAPLGLLYAVVVVHDGPERPIGGSQPARHARRARAIRGNRRRSGIRWVRANTRRRSGDRGSA
jgi:hypothetical protein